MKLPDNAIFFVDDVAIPHNWYTVETGVNDKLYFRLQLANGGSIMDRIITLDAGTYTPTVFKELIKNQVSAAANAVATTTAYDTSTNILSISVANLDINFLTDKELKELTSVTWNGAAYSSSNLSSANELIANNSLPSPVGNTASPAKYTLNLQLVRNIYLRSPNISSFTTIGCNGESSIIKKIPVTSNFGDMVFNNVTSANDFLECGKATWKTLEFHLLDVNSNYINLHGLDISFSLILDKQVTME